MRSRVALALAIVGALALWSWRSQLFTVSRPGEAPRPLIARRVAERAPAILDAVLPVVPVGMKRMRPGSRVALIHYWAPWERHSRAQAAGLDSLAKTLGAERVDVALVCFDPFPSVARFVARQRLRVPVLIDAERQMRRALPCPSIPFTYVLDTHGRIAVAQPGEIDWLAPSTRRTLEDLIEESGAISGPSEPRRLPATTGEGKDFIGRVGPAS